MELTTNLDKVVSESPGNEASDTYSQDNFLKDDGLALLHVDPSSSTVVNRSIKTQQSNEGAYSIFYAGYQINSQSYYGIEVTTDVYDLHLDGEQHSGIMVSFDSRGDDKTQSNVNELIVGWHVYPRYYGDSHVHFFVRWTRDGYKKTGCYNLDCPGYVPEDGVSIVPGLAIDPVSVPGGIKHIIIFKIFKDNTGDNWLLYCGLGSEPYLIGRFPSSLFTTMRNKADYMKIGGFAVARTTRLAPMGSGYLPTNPKAASFSNVQLIDQDGLTSKIPRDIHQPLRLSQSSILHPLSILRVNSPMVGRQNNK
uniref:Neprosin PEP catalytic domain-containing protein n=1 Tax=Leersia perrieri TaxID=77586 RepID=A0A0D9V7H6_9ORYZ